MQILSVGLKFPQINFKSGTLKTFTVPIKSDSFESSKLSLKDAIAEVKNIKTSEGRRRFDRYDCDDFAKFYSKNEIDIDTVETFADTKLDMKSMANVYKLYQTSLKDGIDMKKEAYKPIHDKVKNIENNEHRASISESLFNKNKEITIIDKEDDTRYTYTSAGENIAKSYSKEVNIDGETVRELTTEDYRANSVNTNLQKVEILYSQEKGMVKRFSTYKEIIDYKDEKGKTKYKKISELSKDVPGNMNMQLVYPDGKAKDLSKVTKDAKTGIISVKKDFTSPDGTHTKFLYEDDPQGNRIIDYHITDEKGNTLYKNSQTFEVISDNKFISSNDSRKYEINVKKDSISVKEVNLGKEATIQFKKEVESFNRKEIISLLKKVPGHLLFEAAQDVKKYSGLQKDEALLAYSITSAKLIASADNLFIFLHELGHIKDSETVTSKDTSKRHHEESQYTGNKNIQKVYKKELDNFVKKYPHAQRENVAYFLENGNHYAGNLGGLSELVAETNAIGSAIMTKDSERTAIRAEYLQENFPKTIAEIKNAMRWKDDLDAIEFYGT